MNNNIEEKNKALARSILNEMFSKIDYESFLDIFTDTYNWFAFLGISEEDYKSLSLKVSKERISSEKTERQKVLTR